MNKLLPIVVIFLVGMSVWYFSLQSSEETANVAAESDYRNVSYAIAGQSIRLEDGIAEDASIADSATKLMTRLFGNEVRADLNGDGVEDIAFIVTQDGAGSGTFFYVTAALGAEGGYRGVNAVFLGDRIAPQTTEFRNGEIIVNYADRRIDDPFTAEPTVGVSKYFSIQNDELVEVAK